MQWVWIAVIVVVPILAILVVAIVWSIVRQSRGRTQRMKEAVLEMQIKEGLSTVMHLDSLYSIDAIQKFLATQQAIIIFISHQLLAWIEPDV